MNIKTVKDGEKLTISVEGNLNTSNAVEFDAEVKNNIEGAKELVFDFAGVDYMASAGLRVLMSANKTMKKQGGKIKIINAAKPVMDVFAITGVADVLDITPA